MCECAGNKNVAGAVHIHNQDLTSGQPSRAGQDSFTHGASGHRFATVEGAWTWYLDGRTRAQVTTQAPAPTPVLQPVDSPAAEYGMGDTLLRYVEEAKDETSCM